MTFDTQLRALRDFQPEWGLVLGSGLGALSSRLTVAGRAGYGELGLPLSRAPGHEGQLLWGNIGGRRVLVASGRVHLYEGRSAAEVTALVRLMAQAGVPRLILTNAAGTLNEAHPPGAWMSITDHLNLTGASPLRGGPNFLAMDGIYSKRLRALFATAADEEALPLYEGVYAGVVGPQYETPAEVRMLRLLGADAVGMSTVLEAIQAHALGVEVAGFSCLTNWAAGLSDEPLSHESVLASGREAAEAFWRILTRALRAD
jgi:purine-nucleoside phosphorylase